MSLLVQRPSDAAGAGRVRTSGGLRRAQAFGMQIVRLFWGLERLLPTSRLFPVPVPLRIQQRYNRGQLSISAGRRTSG